MADKKYDENTLQKSDFDTIIEVNNKAIELQTETSDQYEEIIDSVNNNTQKIEKLEDKLESALGETKKIQEMIEKVKDTQFKILLLISSGIISLLIQIIMALKK